MASEQSGEPEIWIMDADGSNGRPLTSNKKFKTLPVVSPDGKYIVYSEFGTLVRINIDGSNPLILDQVPGADNPDVSHDSKWIIYSAWIDGIQRIVRIPIDGGEPQILTKARATEPRYSTDGSRFACFVQNESTNDYDQLAIFPAEGGEPLKTFPIHPNANIGRGPVWTPDDKGITLVVSPGELQNLWLQPIAGGEAKQMTNFGIPGVARRQYSRDGKRIALVRAEGIGNAIMISDFR
jgi:TolB protein